MAIDTRITLVASLPLTISTNVTTTGETVDFKDGYVGDHFEGAMPGYGLGVKILFKTITGTAFDMEVMWQVSDDGNTWVNDQMVYDDDLVAEVDASGDSLELSTRLRTPRRYGRLRFVTTNISGESVIIQQVAVSDGTSDHGFSTNLIKIPA